MMLRPCDRRGATPGDVLIGLSTVLLIAALLYPVVQGRRFRGTLGAAVTDVDAMQLRARDERSRTGAWPGESVVVRDAFTLQWKQWEVVEKAPAPPSVVTLPADADAPPDSVGPILIDVVSEVGAVVVFSTNDALLAELLAHYGTGVSFVRDTTWTLVVDEGGG